jgi:hypothetical protein
MVKDPSPTSRLQRLGMRKATKKASAAIPAPKKLAITISRKKPRILLSKVPVPMTVAALVILWFSDIKGSKNEHSQRFCSLESRKDLDTRYIKMLKKSIINLIKLLILERRKGIRKEAKFWQSIYRRLNGQDKTKRKGFGTSTSKPQ